MKKRWKMLIGITALLILIVLISIHIIREGREIYGDNWIDYSLNPSTLYYEGQVFYEISTDTYFKETAGDKYSFEYTDKLIRSDGKKAALWTYFTPKILSGLIGEAKDKNGNVKYVYVLGFEHTVYCFKLSEEE
ncbi:MAG: hypothetical protein K6C99_08045 [Lachnospiraceae bacterium]|nr:hypothetical protein [Lachnospiraceae bacterium]